MPYDFEHGKGTEANPYQIWNQTDLEGIRDVDSGGQPNYFGKYYIQKANIELDGYSSCPELVKGGYDGNNFSISYLEQSFIKNIEGSYVKNITFIWPLIITSNFKSGIFESVTMYNRDVKSVLKDIRVLYGVAYGVDYVGMIAGEIFGTDVSDCFVLGCQIEGEYSVGGMFGLVSPDGWENRSIISNCVVQAAVDGTTYVGGFAGEIRDSFVEKCGVEVFLVVGDSYVGGFVGYSNDSVIKDCYAYATELDIPIPPEFPPKGTVYGDSYVGGFSGMVTEAPPAA